MTNKPENKSLNDFPEYQKEQERLIGIEDQIRSEKAAIAAALELINSKRDVRGAAVELLAGKETEPLDIEDARNEMTRRNSRLKVLLEAAGIQKNRMENLRNQLSMQVHKELYPEYRGLVREIVAAGVDMARANSGLKAFFDELTDGGFLLGTLTDGLWARTGYYDDPESLIHFHVRSMKEAGLIDASEYPAPPAPKPTPPPAGYESLLASPDGIRTVRHDGAGGIETVKVLAKAKKEKKGHPVSV